MRFRGHPTGLIQLSFAATHVGVNVIMVFNKMVVVVGMFQSMEFHQPSVTWYVSNCECA